MSQVDGGGTPEAVWIHFCRVPELQGFCRPEFNQLLSRMLADPQHQLREAAGQVPGRYGFEVVQVYDTMTAVPQLRDWKSEGSHNLKVVCKHELGIDINKDNQTSDWSGARWTRARSTTPRWTSSSS